MDGQFKALKKGNKTCVVQALADKFREARQLKLARIANGADPKYKNGYKASK